MMNKIFVYFKQVENLDEETSKDKIQSETKIKNNSINIVAQNEEAKLDSSDNTKNASGDGGDKPQLNIKHIEAGEPSK